MEIRVRGRLGNDPELKTVTADNLPLVTFSLAYTPRSKKNGEWVDGETNWYRVAKFGRNAELFAQTLKKGDEVIVIGTAKLNTYTDKNGAEKTQLEINAAEIGFVPKLQKATGPVGYNSNEGYEQPW
jgi:single-strand DNA-binding protein